MKTLLPLIAVLAAVPCYAQTPSPTPASTGSSFSSTGGNGAGMQKLEQMTPEQRQQFLKDHPEIRERLRHEREELLDKLQTMTPDQRQQFLQNHPKLQTFVANHPELAQKIANGDPGHPRVNEVNNREQNQQARINQGVNTGSLTPQEAAKAENGEKRIQTQEGNDLSKNDGHLTPGEDRRLNREENRESRRIHREKHNDQTTTEQ